MTEADPARQADPECHANDRAESNLNDREIVVTIQTDCSLIDPSAFLAPGCVVLGEVRIGAESSVWFGAAMRGDAERIDIGARTNVQDQCVLHGDPGMPCRLGNDVTIGHGAVVHGATVDDHALIGIGAIVLNGARVGRGSVVAAGALVTEGTEIPDGMLAVGSPAKVIKPVSEELARRIRDNCEHYVRLGQKYKARYVACGAESPGHPGQSPIATMPS